VRIADGVDDSDHGGMPKLRLALRLHPIDMLRVPHIQYIERKLHGGYGSGSRPSGRLGETPVAGRVSAVVLPGHDRGRRVNLRFQESQRLRPLGNVCHERRNLHLLRGNLGDALARINRAEEARRAWLESVRLDRQALSVNPNDATTFARIALREAKLGDQSAAEADITRALSLNASDSEVLYHAAVVRTLNGDVERALTLLEQALKNGYSSAIARRDRDLDGIRQLTRFHQMVGSPQ
jgi:tetratricopeptide (TPR) repeat protein